MYFVFNFSFISSCVWVEGGTERIVYNFFLFDKEDGLSVVV